MRKPGYQVLFAELDWKKVRAHYLERKDVHKKLLALRDAGKSEAFVNLLLGIGAGSIRGNYSATDHQLGPKIRHRSSATAIIDLADKLRTVKNPYEVPQLVKAANLPFLKVGVGSEASCMLNPEVCWVANTRTIWSHLVLKHQGNLGHANEELKLYRDDDDSSEMAYQKWAGIHRELGGAMKTLNDIGKESALAQKVTAGKVMFLWCDAVASAFYAHYHAD